MSGPWFRGVGMNLETAVRGRVRERGLDPFRQPSAVRALAEDVAVELDASPEQAKAATDAVLGYGPLQPYFDDPSVEEIWVNEPGRVFVARNGRSELTTTILEEAELAALVERMLRLSGRRIDTSSPFVDALLADGSRLHAVIPDITRRHMALNVRKFVIRPRGIEDLVTAGSLTDHAARFLEASVIAGLNIVVAGATQAGKTTMLSALLASVPAAERIVSCEEVFELHLHAPDSVALQTRDAGLDGFGEVSLRRLVRESLRMRPNRLVVGEVRGAEALDMLTAMNAGLPAMATIHANSAREAVSKLCALPLLAGGNVPADFVLPAVAGSVDLVVHLAMDRGGRRRVREVVALSGRVEKNVVEIAEIFCTSSEGLVRAGGFPPHAERFARAGIDVVDLLTAER